MEDTDFPVVGVTGRRRPGQPAPRPMPPPVPRLGPSGAADVVAPPVSSRRTAATPWRPQGLGGAPAAGELDKLDVNEHAAVYDAVHRDLRDALADAATGDVADPA